MLLLKHLIVLTSNLFILMPFTNAIITTTSGTGDGIKCGDVYCDASAACVDNVCDCDSKGNGQLKCYDDNTTLAAYVSNDPLLSTWNGEKVHVPLLCTYALSDQITDTITPIIRDDQTCYVRLIPYGGKKRGKIYTRGFYLGVDINLISTTTYSYSVHVDGYAVDGTYYYDAKHMNDDSGFQRDAVLNDTTTVSIDDSSNGIFLQGVEYDTDYNIAFVDIEECGVFVYFRAYDVVLQHRQEMTPFVMMTNSRRHNPYHDTSASLALGLTEFPRWLSDLNIPPASNFSKTMSLLDYSFYSGTMYYPISNPACQSALDTYVNCDNRFNTMSNCLPILETEKFINCYDDTDTGEKLMPLFNACVEIGCGNTTQCTTIPGRFGSCNQLPVSTVDFMTDLCVFLG